MDERLRFIVECQESMESFSAICRTFGVSRKTGYKWVERYETLGASGLCEVKQVPDVHPGWLKDAELDVIIQARKEHPHWGPKKLQVLLVKSHPDMPRVGVSTIAGVLKRFGLIQPRRRRPRAPVFDGTLDPGSAVNDVWAADFKGHFALGNGDRCYPLTITDSASRFILKCEGLSEPKEAPVRVQFERAFVEFGLPIKLRSDNGPPFASLAPGGLSKLSVWWVKLGILPERIEPGHPEQNGRHERMHRTLKAEATQPAERDLKRQQRVFDTFRRHFNQERPHEALGQKCPASGYCASTRTLPSTLRSPEYASGMETRKLDSHGRIRWKMDRLTITPLLAGEPVATREIDDDRFELFFGPILLGDLETRKGASRFVCKR